MATDVRQLKFFRKGIYFINLATIHLIKFKSQIKWLLQKQIYACFTLSPYRFASFRLSKLFSSKTTPHPLSLKKWEGCLNTVKYGKQMKIPIFDGVPDQLHQTKNNWLIKLLFQKATCTSIYAKLIPISTIIIV